MTKFARMLDVLDLYSEQDTLLTAEEIAVRLDVSRTTAFRYARELSEAGFLANYGGRYSLGAHIITLDYRIRKSDPVLRAAQDVMSRLTMEAPIAAFLCRMYNEEVVIVHGEKGYESVLVSFGRGQPMPLFRGAASKTLLAFMPPRRLRRIYDRNSADPEVLQIASNWPEFNAYYREIRNQGYYVSRQEIESDQTGIAAPISIPGTGVVAVLSIVLPTQRLALLNIDGLTDMVLDHANEITLKLRGLGVPDEEPETVALPDS